ncbi:hypothetical protein ACP70R_018754 [Stipagrostis hirtigluma subsp. patula]
MLPACYDFTTDKVTPATTYDVSLPIINLSNSREEVCRDILNAGKDLGFFQVVNHGVPEQVMRDMEEVSEEFFQLPAADRAYFYSEDGQKPSRLFSSSVDKKHRRDCLRFACTFPISCTSEWPDRPQRLREVVEKFIVLTRGVGMEILRLLCEGMELRSDYFEGELSGTLTLDINQYPRCLNPSMTLGLPPHCDRSLVTILQPGPVHGLEVAYKGNWIKVEPAPNAFVINFGMPLEVISNGMLKSIQHRVVTNPTWAWTSIATFIDPTADCLIGPAKEFLNEDNPPRYSTLRFREFVHIYNVEKLGSSLSHTTNLKNIRKEI